MHNLKQQIYSIILLTKSRNVQHTPENITHNTVDKMPKCRQYSALKMRQTQTISIMFPKTIKISLKSLHNMIIKSYFKGKQKIFIEIP